MKNLSQYFKRWYYFLISIIICIGLAAAYLYITTPVYKINATLIIQDDKKGEGMLKETAFNDLNMFHTVKNVDNEIQILLSADLLEKVFQKLSLNVQYFVSGDVFRKEIYGKEAPFKVVVMRLTDSAYLEEPSIAMVSDSTFNFTADKSQSPKLFHFGRDIRMANYTIKIIKMPKFHIVASPVYFKFNNLKNMATAYSVGKLDVAPVIKDANTISITVNDNIPQRGIDILNTLITIYNQNNIDSKSKLAYSTVEFIDNRIKLLSGDLLAVDQSLEQYKQDNMVTDANSDANVNLHRADDYSQELGKMDLQIKMLNAIEQYFNQPLGKSVLVPSTLAIQDGGLSALINRYNGLQLDYQNLLNTNQPGNPLVLNVKQQLFVLKQNIQENLNNIKRGLQLSYDNLASHTSKFQSKVKIAPSIARQLLERNRQQAVKETLFAYLVQKREETAMSLAATKTDAEVIVSPRAGVEPESPAKSMILLYATMLGGIIPIFIIKGKGHLSNKVSDVNELNLLPGIRIIGELSHTKETKSLVVGCGSRTNISELFRYLRVNLNFDINDHLTKVLMVTSSVQGEGKTFVSLNLGATLAGTNKRVLMLEFDLRKPDLLNRLKLNNSVGITDYLNSDKINIVDIIKPSGVAKNLWVLGSGKLSKDPYEELLNPKMDRMFNELKAMFDYIIIDTSPVGLVADAFSFERFTDATLYLVRYNYTEKNNLKIIEDVLKNKKLTNPMIVLNDAKPENLVNYGYASANYVYKA